MSGRICIAGTSECGKTTLAKRISRNAFVKLGKASLVLDPWRDNWGPHCWIAPDEVAFWEAVWQRKGELIIVDEGSSTIARDRELVPAFTKIRHQEHTLIVICHDATDLLPVMRRNLNELFLFLQTPASIETWKSDFPGMSGLEQATTLGRFEYLHCKNFATATKGKLKI